MPRLDFEGALDAAMPTIPAVESYVADVLALPPAERDAELERRARDVTRDRLAVLRAWQVESREIADALEPVVFVCRAMELSISERIVRRQIARLRERAGEA